MEGTLVIDWWAVLGLTVVILGCFLARRWIKRRETISVAFSHLGDLRTDKLSWKLRLAKLPAALLTTAALFFALAFIDPHLRVREPGSSELPRTNDDEPSIEEVAIPTEGIALYFVLDQSGSMSQLIELQTFTGITKKLRRIDFLKEVTSQFIKGNPQTGLGGRPQDMIGILAFARVPEILSPLTLDHEAVLQKLSSLDVVSKQKRDGTGIGYAIYKTAHLIAASKHFAQELLKEGKPSYAIKSQVMIVVTDGLQNPNPLDSGHPRRTVGVKQAAEKAAQEEIRVYIVNVEPRIRQGRFRHDREELQQAAELTGGRFFIAEDATELLEIYTAIDRLEKTALPQKKTGFAEVVRELIADKETPYFQRVSFFPYLVALGLLCFASGVILGATYLRRVP